MPTCLVRARPHGSGRYTTAAIWPAIVEANEDGPTVAHVCNEDLRTKRQGAMSSSKSVRTRHFATGGTTAPSKAAIPVSACHEPERQHYTAANDNRYIGFDLRCRSINHRGVNLGPLFIANHPDGRRSYPRIFGQPGGNDAQSGSVPASTTVQTAAAKQHNENNNDKKRGDIHLRLPPNAAYCAA